MIDQPTLEEIRKAIGLRLRERREELNKTRQEIADFCEIAVDTITKIENGINFPSVTVLLCIISYLHMDFSFSTMFYKQTQRDRNFVVMYNGLTESSKTLIYKILMDIVEYDENL